LDDKSLRELSLALRQLHSLTVLSLNFKLNRNITAKGIAELLKTVKKNRFLTELYLDFNECGAANEEHLTSIFNSISSMKLLKSFHINYFHLIYRPLDWTTGEQLSKNLLKLRRLNYMEDFSMNLEFWHGLQSHDITALSKSLSRMVRLSKLYLSNLDCPNFDQIGLKSLSDSLKSLRMLKKLHLHFSSYSDRNDLISKAIENSLTLSHLILDFSRAAIAIDSTKNLLLSLQTLKNLSKLDINFSHTQHSDNDLIQFLSQGISNLTNLSLLRLNFYACPLINGQGLIHLTSALENVTSLKVFELTLTNQSLQSVFLPFSEALGHLTNLSRLMLNFAHSQDFGNQEIKALTKSLQKFENLESLELNLSYYLQITDEGFNDLASQICNFRSLKMLNLNFYGCHQITAEGFEYLKSQISQLESLKRTYLNFPSITNNYGGFAQQQKSSKKSTCSLF